MNVRTEELARVMFSAGCRKRGFSEEDVISITGEGAEAYEELAAPLVKLINEHEEEAVAAAEFILNRKKVSSLFRGDSFQRPRGPCDRILP
jgi:hypothetical protein